jgi:hypothetical protein
VTIVEKAGWDKGPVRRLWRIEKFSPLGFVTKRLSPHRVASQNELSRVHLFEIQIYNCQAPHTDGTPVHSTITFLVFRPVNIILKKIFQIVHYIKE